MSPDIKPIIFIGMHRSGTSMLGNLMDSIGQFSGFKKNIHNEAVFFRDINAWLMSQCGARWDNPSSMKYLWSNIDLVSCIEAYIRDLMASPRAIEFTGFYHYLTKGGIANLDILWGWKDPRNTFTLPIWLKIFPNAKIVVIERHGVDVAQSLRVRSRKGYIQSVKKYQKYRLLAPYRPKKGGFLESPRCATLEGGFSLWQNYMAQGREVVKTLPETQVFKLRYEELLNDPFIYLQACAKFCNLDCTEQRIHEATKQVESSKAFAYLNEVELADFARIHRNELAKYGY